MRYGFKINKTGFIILIAIILTCCSSEFYMPTTKQISLAQKKWPEADSSYLYNGYYLYKIKCSNCHYLYKPGRYTSEQWKHLLPEMKDKAKLTDEDYQKIKIYLFAFGDGNISN